MNVTPSATLSSLRGCGNQSRFPMTGKRQKSQMCSWRKPRRRSLLEEVRPSALQANTSHLSVPVKVIENISRHTRDHRVIWISQHGFSEGRSCLTYLVFFYEQMIGSGDNGRRDVKFVKVLDTVSQSTLTAKLVGRWLYKWTVVRTKLWLDLWVQRPAMSSMKSRWHPGHGAMVPICSMSLSMA